MSNDELSCPLKTANNCVKDGCAWWIPNAEECAIAVIAVYIAGMWRDKNV